MAGQDARAPYTAGTAPDYHLDMEVARMDGAATVLIQRTRASIVGVPTVAVVSATQFVVPPATQFSVVGLPTVVQANPQATVTLTNPAQAPLATVAVGTMAPVSVANPQATVTLTNPAAAPLATVAIGTYAPPATVAVATLAFPTLNVATAHVVPPATSTLANPQATVTLTNPAAAPLATVAVGTVAGLPTVTIANPQATVSLAGGTVTVANANATQAIGTVAGLPTVTPYTPPPSCVVRAMSYRVHGRAALAQNVLSIWNGSPSIVLDLLKLTVECDYSNIAVPTIAGPIFRAYRLASTTPFASGIDITARKFTNNPNHSSHASVVVRCDASADNVIAGAAITASYLGAGASQPFGMAMPQKPYTLVGIGPTPDLTLVDADEDRRAPQIWPAQGAIIQMTVPSTGQSPTALSFTVEGIWREYIA